MEDLVKEALKVNEADENFNIILKSIFRMIVCVKSRHCSGVFPGVSNVLRGRCSGH